MTTHIGADSDNDTANALALQPDGRIVLAGAGGGGAFALARYLNASGRAPRVRVVGGDCRDSNDASAVVRLSLADRDTPAGDLTVAATSSNPALLADFTVAGNGASRTLALSGARKRSGTATVTVSVGDGASTTTLVLRIVVGTHRGETLKGDDGVDVIFGRQGADTLRGAGATDLLCGGNGGDHLNGGPSDDWLFGQNGADTLTGGPGADRFSGGPGADRTTDLNPRQGDRSEGR